MVKMITEYQYTHHFMQTKKISIHTNFKYRFTCSGNKYGLRQQQFVLQENYFRGHKCSCIWQMLLFKATHIAFKVCILSDHAFTGNQTHYLGITRDMLYCLNHQ